MPYGGSGHGDLPPVPPPPAPAVEDGVGVADGLAAPRAPMTCAPADWVPAVGVLDGAMPAGTGVTVDPISTSTWPAGRCVSAVAVAPNSAAICCAFAEAPAP